MIKMENYLDSLAIRRSLSSSSQNFSNGLRIKLKVCTVDGECRLLFKNENKEQRNWFSERWSMK
jgi:hypothetical protein